MRPCGKTGLAICATLAWLCAPASSAAASFDCNVRGLSAAEKAICRDPQLSRIDEQIARRLEGFQRRMNYGQYVGLRFWQSSQQRDRERCGADTLCISTTYRLQMRFLDRLQQCLETSPQRRACLRNTLNLDRDALRERKGEGELTTPSAPAGRRARASARLAQHGLDVLPVDEIVEPGLEVFRARVAIVDVVAVLPDVDAEDWRGSVHERIFAIGRLLHL